MFCSRLFRGECFRCDARRSPRGRGEGRAPRRSDRSRFSSKTLASVRAAAAPLFRTPENRADPRNLRPPATRRMDSAVEIAKRSPRERFYRGPNESEPRTRFDRRRQYRRFVDSFPRGLRSLCREYIFQRSSPGFVRNSPPPPPPRPFCRSPVARNTVPAVTTEQIVCSDLCGSFAKRIVSGRTRFGFSRLVRRRLSNASKSKRAGSAGNE